MEEFKVGDTVKVSHPEYFFVTKIIDTTKNRYDEIVYVVADSNAIFHRDYLEKISKLDKMLFELEEQKGNKDE